MIDFPRKFNVRKLLSPWARLYLGFSSARARRSTKSGTKSRMGTARLQPASEAAPRTLRGSPSDRRSSSPLSADGSEAAKRCRAAPFVVTAKAPPLAIATGALRVGSQAASRLGVNGANAVNAPKLLAHCRIGRFGHSGQTIAAGVSLCPPTWRSRCSQPGTKRRAATPRPTP